MAEIRIILTEEDFAILVNGGELVKESPKGGFMDRLLLAFKYILKYHGGKFYGSKQYAFHCIEVAEQINSWCIALTSEDLIIGALLHDIMKDSDCRYTELEEVFGEKTAREIKEVTRPAKYIINGDIKTETTDGYFKRMSKEAQLIKTADRICNLRNMGRNRYSMDKHLFWISLPKYEEEMKHFKDWEHFDELEMVLKKAREQREYFDNNRKFEVA